MLKKTITYKDVEGVELTEDFFFHISKSELIELELSEEEGLHAMLQKIMKSNNNRLIFAQFKRILLLSYGVKSPDGRRFIKNDQVREEFSQTNAFDELIIDLMTNVQSAAEFITGLVPKEVSELMPISDDVDIQTRMDHGIRPIETVELPSTKKDLQEMTREELLAAFNKKVQESNQSS